MRRAGEHLLHDLGPSAMTLSGTPPPAAFPNCQIGRDAEEFPAPPYPGGIRDDFIEINSARDAPPTGGRPPGSPDKA
jgi:hypothetical protein